MPTTHQVQQGDCISSIAARYGFLPSTLWNDPANETLRRQRQDPNVLCAGDLVVIPDLRPKHVSRPTGRTHTFRLQRRREELKLQLKRRGQPRAHLPYLFEVDGQVVAEGTTDAEGRLVQPIPPGARAGRLILGDTEAYELELGHLDPVDTESGARHRLLNLGLLDAVDADEATWRRALRTFQASRGLAISGELDAPTQAKLVEVHGR